jgi:acetyltransferase-like isoleucine patch superfamily enzyme
MHADGVLNIGDGCTVNAVSRDGIRFGNNVSLQRGVVIELTGSLQSLGAGVTIGKNVGIGSGSFIGGAGGVEIGDDTIVGNFVSFHSENHVFTDPDTPIRAQGTIRSGISIGRDCWIGAKATILDGVIVGDGSIVAAGAVVKAGRYPGFAILGGVPARVIGIRNGRREWSDNADGDVDESRQR